MSTTHDTTHTNSRPEATDALFSLEPSDLAVRFGQRTKQLMKDGRDPYEAARLAGSFAARAIAQRPKVIGMITPAEPYGVNL